MTLAPPAPTRLRRRPLVVAAVASVVVVLVGAALAWWRYAATYAPLRPTYVVTPYLGDGPHIDTLDRRNGSDYFVRGPAGTIGGIAVDIENDGRFDVTVDDIDYGDAFRVRWAPYREPPPPGVAVGQQLPLRALPAQLPAHDRVWIVLTFRKPDCEVRSNVEADSAIVRWQALNVHHEQVFDLLNTMGGYLSCPRTFGR